jgi:hypothetical protein
VLEKYGMTVPLDVRIRAIIRKLIVGVGMGIGIALTLPLALSILPVFVCIKAYDILN